MACQFGAWDLVSWFKKQNKTQTHTQIKKETLPFLTCQPLTQIPQKSIKTIGQICLVLESLRKLLYSIMLQDITGKE